MSEKDLNKSLMDKHRGATELEKSKIFIVVETVEYTPKVVTSKTFINRPTGNVTVSSLDAGEIVAEKISPFDTFIHVIDGMAQLTINKTIFTLDPGEVIIIPAHAKHDFIANVPFKMIITVIKSGYEDL